MTGYPPSQRPFHDPAMQQIHRGPPMGVFPATSHSAFDDSSPTLSSMSTMGPTAATPSSIFGNAGIASNSKLTSSMHGASDKISGSGKKKANDVKKAPAAAKDSEHPGKGRDAQDNDVGGAKKTPRDSKRRATHSQIERRRREKINDRLITLRNLVPACVKEVEDRAQAKIEEEQEAGRIAAGLVPASTTTKGKRKRIRKKAESAKEKDADKEPELGLHKLEVLTHTIDYIYDLQARIEELETGIRPARVRRVEDNEDEMMDDDGHSRDTGKTVKKEVAELISSHASRRQDEDDDEEDELADVPPFKRRGSVMDPPTEEAAVLPPRSRGASADSETASESGTGNQSPYHDVSPMFPARTASSSVSSITSPFMSLSATSPIFLERKNGSTSSTSAMPGWTALTLPPTALNGAETRNGGSANQADGDNPTMGRSQHGSLSAIRSDMEQDGHVRPENSSEAVAATNDDTSAAQLLLAFSGSPEEALRPQGSSSKRTTPTTKPAASRRFTTSLQMNRRVSTQMPAFSTPQVRPFGSSNDSDGEGGQQKSQANLRSILKQYGRKVLDSAPGGSTAVGQRGREALLSPPPLELDAGTQGR
ncbi:unnamed protein product [Sympodiomycopsis kandeliae]